MNLTPEQQKQAIQKIAAAMKKSPKDTNKLDRLLGKVLEMELPEEDAELVGEWERLNREQ